MRHVLDRKNESDTVKQSPIARSIAFVNVSTRETVRPGRG
jgi:hypothetical protein